MRSEKDGIGLLAKLEFMIIDLTCLRFLVRLLVYPYIILQDLKQHVNLETFVS